MLLRLLITAALGAAGAWALYKLRAPAGAMVGAILLVGVFQIATGCGYFPKAVKPCVQAVAGGFVGQRIGRSDLKELRKIVRPSLQLFTGIVCLSFCTGLLIHHTSPVDTATALLSSMPGGITDVALISADVGADPAQSTALQLVRYLIAILILPPGRRTHLRPLGPLRREPIRQGGPPGRPNAPGQAADRRYAGHYGPGRSPGEAERFSRRGHGVFHAGRGGL